MDRLNAEIDWFSSKKIEFVFCCDANFGILPRDVDIARTIATKKSEHGFPKAFSVQNTKNATERAYLTQKILSDSGLNKGVALSLQSVDVTTLKNIKRQNISLQTYEELQARFTRDRVETYSDLILGLPGETYESFVEGVCRVIENGQHNRIQFNNLSILPNAEMGDPAYLKEYGMETVETKIINIHGALDEDEIPEVQQLVVATKSMSREDWRRSRSFAWMAALVHFDKLVQIRSSLPTNSGCLVSHHHRVVHACRYGRFRCSRKSGTSLTFRKQIQAGGPEYVYSQEWLGIYWPRTSIFSSSSPPKAACNSSTMNGGALLRSLASRNRRYRVFSMRRSGSTTRWSSSPASTRTSRVLRRDLLGFYRSVLIGEPIQLKRQNVNYAVKRSAKPDGFQRMVPWVVWYGTKGRLSLRQPGRRGRIAGHTERTSRPRHEVSSARPDRPACL